MTAPFDAFVLAAGLGTRLRPLTSIRPKPLVPVCGVPLLAYSLALCARHGLRRVVVNAHHLADQLVPWAGVREGVEVSVVVEEALLGTGGGLRAVADRLADPFVVLNADVLHGYDLGALRAAVPPGGAAMALRPSEEAARYGVVAGDASGRVVELVTVASAPAEGPVDRGTHFTGIHALSRAALAPVPEGFSDIVRTAYRALVPERRVAAVRCEGLWLDAGDPAAYLEANLEVLSGRHRLALDPHARAAFAVDASGRAVGAPPRGVRVDGPCWIGPGARLGEGVVLDGAVIGAGATVDAGAVRRCVVWDGVRAPPGDLVDRVVHAPG